MGDVAMTIPVIASCAHQYPDVHISMLTNVRFADMFDPRENLDFIGINTKKQYKGIRGMWRLFRFLIAYKQFDAVIDLHNVIRSKILRTLFRFKKIPVFVLDKERKEKKTLIRQRNKKRVPLKNAVTRYYEVFEKAGYSFPITFQGLFPKKMDLPENIRFLTEEKTNYRIAIAPFAQHTGKIYPLEKMEKIIAEFSARGNTTILLFGGGTKEKEILENWEKKYPHVISLAGKFSLHYELQILNYTDVLIAMDSANMHLASLVQTPVVSIWGATHPFAGFYGFNQSPDHIIQTELECRPCSIYGNKPCLRQDYACLHSIDPDQIVRKVDSLLLN
jgi:ADP-heptose:LPS heptosyltransferase